MTNALPLNFPDVVCVDDLDPLGSEITSDLQGLTQDVYHMLVETPGSNIDDTTRGIGLGQLLSASTVALNDVEQRIDRGLEQDDRIDVATATLIQQSADTFELDIVIEVAGSVLSLQYAFDAVGGLRVR